MHIILIFIITKVKIAIKGFLGQFGILRTYNETLFGHALGEDAAKGRGV